jgi:hypothetical protein
MEFKLEFELDFCAESCLIHNFRFIGPKIANLMSLEILQSIESNNAIIFHSCSIQIEVIFKLNQILLPHQ